MRRSAPLLVAALLAAGVGLAAPVHAAADGSAVPRAVCGPGARPETGVQGQVPRADRDSGRSRQGYTCNVRLVGQHQGQGATWVQPSYGTCSYVGSFLPGNAGAAHPGVSVLDVRRPDKPVYTTSLTSPAMRLGTWESLKVSESRGLLAATGVSAPPGAGVLTFDVYDVRTDCRHPRLLNGLAGTLTLPTAVAGHEGAFAPDGRTYYAMNANQGLVTAIDVADPAHPRVVYTGSVGGSNHGVSFSPDGRRMYGVTAVPAGLQVLDVSDVQDRKPLPQVRQLSSVSWTDGLFSQHTLPFTAGGHRYLYVVDEAGGGGVRLFDLADETAPRLVRQYRLGINQPENRSLRSADTGGDGVFGYDAHYCSLDRPTDPTLLACSYFQSGVRLFDVRDPRAPRELGYFQPPAQTGKEAQLVNSAHANAYLLPDVLDPDSINGQNVVDSTRPSLSTDWCTSPPAFRPGGQLWVTCQDNGFLVLDYRQALRAVAAAAPRATTAATRPAPVAAPRRTAAGGRLPATGRSAGWALLAAGLLCGAAVVRRSARP